MFFSRSAYLLIGLVAAVMFVACMAPLQPAPSSVPNEVPVVADDIEVAIYMGRIQRFHQKWWAAGRAGNARLAYFYLHEMEEAMEDIANGNVHQNNADVSNFIRIYGQTTVKRLQTILKTEGTTAMMAQGEIMVENCNACHTACGYPFLRVKVPTEVSFPDQDFSPLSTDPDQVLEFQDND